MGIRSRTDRRSHSSSPTRASSRSSWSSPGRRSRNAGGTPELISPKGGKVQSFDHLDPSKSSTADQSLDDADPADFDGLVLPGGVANPDFLRTDGDVQRFVRGFFDEGKPVAVICHGPWTLIDAGVLDGRTITSWPTLRTDLTKRRRNWVDEEVHVEGGLVSSRKPDDLPAFCEQQMLAQFAAHGSRTAQSGSRSDG